LSRVVLVTGTGTVHGSSTYYCGESRTTAALPTAATVLLLMCQRQFLVLTRLFLLSPGFGLLTTCCSTLLPGSCPSIQISAPQPPKPLHTHGSCLNQVYLIKTLYQPRALIKIYFCRSAKLILGSSLGGRMAKMQQYCTGPVLQCSAVLQSVVQCSRETV
jgi:hypothetical protein